MREILFASAIVIAIAGSAFAQEVKYIDAPTSHFRERRL